MAKISPRRKQKMLKNLEMVTPPGGGIVKVGTRLFGRAAAKTAKKLPVKKVSTQFFENRIAGTASRVKRRNRRR